MLNRIEAEELKKRTVRELLGGLVVRILGTAVAWVQSLVRELRSCKPHGMAKKKEQLSL